MVALWNRTSSCLPKIVATFVCIKYIAQWFAMRAKKADAVIKDCEEKLAILQAQHNGLILSLRLLSHL